MLTLIEKLKNITSTLDDIKTKIDEIKNNKVDKSNFVEVRTSYTANSGDFILAKTSSNPINIVLNHGSDKDIVSVYDIDGNADTNNINVMYDNQTISIDMKHKKVDFIYYGGRWNPIL